jgi:ATP-dependent Zn protease
MPELIAYHEAGHALMAVLLGGKVKQVPFNFSPATDDISGCTPDDSESIEA